MTQVPLEILSVPMKAHKLKKTRVMKSLNCNKYLLQWINCYVDAVRSLPLVPPQQLVPWLLKHNLIPNGDDMDAEIERYWQYMSAKGLPNTADKPGTGCIPLWIWGDDCKFNKEGAKIVVVAIGAVLHRTSSSKDSVFPLFSFQVEAQLEYCKTNLN